MCLPTSEAGARNYEHTRRQQERAEAIERLKTITPDIEPARHPGSEQPIKKEPTVADPSVFNERVTSIRVANPTLSLVEAQKLARTHAGEEGFYAPGVGTTGLDSLPMNDDGAPSVTDLLAADMATDPRVVDALRWDGLTPQEKQDEKDGIALHKRLTVIRDALLNRAKETGSAEAVAGLDLLITQSSTTDAVRKAARAVYESQKAVQTPKTIGGARNDVDNALADILTGVQGTQDEV